MPQGGGLCFGGSGCGTSPPFPLPLPTYGWVPIFLLQGRELVFDLQGGCIPPLAHVCLPVMKSLSVCPCPVQPSLLRLQGTESSGRRSQRQGTLQRLHAPISSAALRYNRFHLAESFCNPLLLSLDAFDKAENALVTSVACFKSAIGQGQKHTWASKIPILGFRGGNTVHEGILEFVLYYIRFDLQGGDFPPPVPPPYAHVRRWGITDS